MIDLAERSSMSNPRPGVSSLESAEVSVRSADSTATPHRQLSKAATEAPGVSHLAIWIIRVALVGFAFNVVKGYPTRLQGLMWPNWEFTYRHGPVRRGLGGTLFQAFASGLDRATQQSVALVLHTLACVAFFSGLAVWILGRAADYSPRTRLLASTGLALVLLAPFVPTTTLLAGYFDIYIMLFAVGGAYLASQERYLASGLLTAVAPLLHDGFVFLWLPVVLLVARSVWNAPHQRRILALCAVSVPLLTFAAILAVHTDDRAFRVIDDLSPDLRYSKGAFFSTREAVLRMIDNFRQTPAQLPIATPVFVLPSLCVAVCAYLIGPQRGWKSALTCVAITLSPCAILMVAWDLSRFLIWSTIAAYFALMWSLRHAATPLTVTTPSLRNLCALIVTAAAVCSVGGPNLYAYFHVAFADYPIGPKWLSTTPAAHLSYAWLQLYNRERYVSNFPDTVECLVHGEPAGSPCTFRIDRGRHAVTEPIWLPAGEYVAHVETALDPNCAPPRGQLAFGFDWRHAPSATADFEPAALKTSVPFHLTGETAAMGRLRVTISSERGCYQLNALRIVPRNG